MVKSGFPLVGSGQTIGLLGGSFDPPHAGHVQVTRAAFSHLGLDRVWWLVSPGNPLKARGPAPMARRMAAAQDLVQHPLVRISDIELRLGTQFTAHTIAALKRRYPGQRFVWLMGADNLVQFHHWAHWEEIFASVPIGVIARPGYRLAALRSVAARRFARYRVPAAVLAQKKAPAWAFVTAPLMHLSSSQLRAQGKWPAGDLSV
jgi:nicotinate-nucleotide adenylyltransferase